MNWHGIEPVDVLFLRGNKLFGDPGSYGEALVPPWPSVAAGAIRSAILARDEVNLTAFAQGKETHPTLGKPNAPGEFCVTAFRLARQHEGGWEMLFPQPADLVVSKNDVDEILVERLHPQAIAHGIDSSLPTEKLPVLTQNGRSKPDSGWWLTEPGWAAYLEGKTPTVKQMVGTEKLWAMDERVGVGIEPAAGRADDGKLFTVQAVAFHKGVGFLAATEGDALTGETLLRFGGDGRGAHCQQVDGYEPPEADLDAIVKAKRCRIVLTTPGIFANGWQLPGIDAEGRFEFGGIRGRMVAATVGRAEMISGWDLARWQPKDAQSVAPIGSVYWIEDLEASIDQLRKLATQGLWPKEGYDAQRKAEGFNRFEFATY